MTAAADIDALLGVKVDPQRAARNKGAAIPIVGDRRLARKPSRRKFRNAIRTSSAIEALAELPGEGETHHYVMPGNYDSFDLLAAILYRADPAKITELYLATLGFNANNSTRLLEMADAGDVGRISLVVSHWYNADHKEADVCHKLATELPRRGGSYVAARSHAKIIAAAMTDGRFYVIESSANLRSCNNVEQFTITASRELFEFHREWLDEVHNAAARKNDKR